MTRNHEKLLVAALAGMIIAGAVFAIQPAIAQSTDTKSFSSRLAVPSYAVLDLRLTDKV